MRICIVGSSKKFFSGISAYTIVMANAFAERGHRVSVILLRNLVPLFLYPGRTRVGKGECQIDFHPGIEVYDGMDWNAPLTWTGAYRFLQRQKPDALIMHWWTSSVAHLQIFLALAKHMNGAKFRLALEMHEVVDTLEEKILPIRLYSRIGGKTLLKFCDIYTAHSDEARKAIADTYHIPHNKIHIVPHGPYNIYESLDKKAAKKELNLAGYVLLYFGMIRQYKGVSLLIKAFNKLPADVANDICLVIAGEDWGDDTGIQKALSNSPYREKIIFKSEFIPDDLVPKYFAASDTVVLPYLRTCGSGVVNIAVAQGKPVITADLPTMRECLKGYEGARFFPVGDIDSLCAELTEVYQNKFFTENKYYQFHTVSWENIIDKYERIFHK